MTDILNSYQPPVLHIDARGSILVDCSQLKLPKDTERFIVKVGGAEFWCQCAKTPAQKAQALHITERTIKVEPK